MSVSTRTAPFVVAGSLSLLLAATASVAQPQRNLSVASAEQRVALVIGNAGYQQGPLRNPVNDARAIAERLQQFGFVVIKRENMKAKEIGPALREFRSRLSPGGVALFFYAGHGVQVRGVNYLPMVDAEIDAEEDVPTQALEMNKVLELMEESKTRVNLVFLDACRNNPFLQRFRSASRGLAKQDAVSGTLISFATRPGRVAADGDGTNGLYTEYLLKHMEESGLPIEQVLKRVGAGVKLASKGRQEPWSEGLIEGEFFFRVATQATLSPAPLPEQPPTHLAASQPSSQNLRADTVEPNTRLRLPSDWEERPLSEQMLKGSGVLYALNRTTDSGLLLSVESRKGITDLMAFAASRRAGQVNRLVDAKHSEMSPLVINGRKAFRFEVTGTIKTGARFTYMMTIIEGPTEIVLLNTWANPANFEIQKPALAQLSEHVTPR